MTATITGLHIYPVKSCRGIPLQAAKVSQTGFADDRHWMLVRPNGRFVTQRELPRLALIGTATDAGALTLTAPGMPPLAVARGNGGDARLTVEIHGQRHRLRRPPPTGARISGHAAARLVRFESVSHANVTPPDSWDSRHHRVLGWLPRPGDRARVADGAQFAPAEGASHGALPSQRCHRWSGAYDEDRIHELRTPSVTLRLVKPCTRCSITTTDQQLGAVTASSRWPRSRPIAMTPNCAAVKFGQNVIIVNGAGAQLRVGESFEVSWK
jgi:uncharacterized protein YcbX